MSLRAEIRTEFAAVNTRIDNSTARADACADELSRRIDDNGRRIDRLTTWIAALAERLTKIEFLLTRLEIRAGPHAPPPAPEGLPMPSAEV